MEWISVKDRLPDAFCPVIVYRKGHVERGARDVNGWWKVYGTRTKSVTHWMPLPEPPEEEPPSLEDCMDTGALQNTIILIVPCAEKHITTAVTARKKRNTD